MEPIVAADGREVALECLGCAISKKEVEPPGGMIAETDYFTLANDFEYPIKGFLIVLKTFLYQKSDLLSLWSVETIHRALEWAKR
jgi:hypothetical protein